MAGELRPDLVLMDVHLGSAMDGIDAAQAIRTQFDVTTVFLSAFSGDANSARAQLAKPAGYLAKPFEEYELRKVIEAAFKDV
jgi:two-component system cell cycle sensor histidine kinase/response regulator CckA